MLNFIIKAIEEDFNHLFGLNENELKQMGAAKMIVDKYPGFPCRVSLEDARVGEEVILLPYQHHKTSSPYQACGPIFIRKYAQKAELKNNEIPKFLDHRFLSLRAYDINGMMLSAKSCEGNQLKNELYTIFEETQAAYIHIHNARPGCFNCVAERADE